MTSVGAIQTVNCPRFVEALTLVDCPIEIDAGSNMRINTTEPSGEESSVVVEGMSDFVTLVLLMMTIMSMILLLIIIIMIINDKYNNDDWNDHHHRLGLVYKLKFYLPLLGGEAVNISFSQIIH